MITPRSRIDIKSGLILMCLVGLVGSARGQQPANDGERSWLVSFSHYGRWGGLLSAAGFTALAAIKHKDADIFFDGLLQRCRANSALCTLGADGKYAGADEEILYQETIRLDRQARALLLAGEVSLVASGVMFLIDLVSGNQEPENIPFTPLRFQAHADGLSLGIQF